MTELSKKGIASHGSRSSLSSVTDEAGARRFCGELPGLQSACEDGEPRSARRSWFPFWRGGRLAPVVEIRAFAPGSTAAI